PPPHPLRTGQDRFRSSGSSRSFAPFRTRFRNIQTLTMDFCMTGWVKQHTVFHRIWSAFGPPDNVMVMPSRYLGDLLVADRADAVLFLPQVHELSSPAQVGRHLDTEAFLEVDLPGRVERVGACIEFDMPFNRNGCRRAKMFGLAVCDAKEHPMVVP